MTTTPPVNETPTPTPPLGNSDEIIHRLQTWGKSLCWGDEWAIGAEKQQKLHELLTESAQLLAAQSARLAAVGEERDEAVRAIDKAFAQLGKTEDWLVTPREDLLANGIAHLRAKNQRLSTELHEAKEQWRMSSVCRELKAENERLKGERDEAIKAHGFVWNAARKAAQYFRWAGCRDTIAIEAMNQCCEAEKLTPKWSTDWVIVTPLELSSLRAQLAQCQAERDKR